MCIRDRDSIEIKKSHLGTKISLKEDDFNLLMDLAKENIKSLAAIEKLQKELERIESKSSGPVSYTHLDGYKRQEK